MNGINLAEAGHIVNVLPAVSISGGKTTVPVNMAGFEHMTFVVSFGVQDTAAPTGILLYQTTTEATGTNNALGFRYYYQGTAGAGHDTLDNGPLFATVSGITSFPADVSSLVYVIEVDAAELELVADVAGTITEYPYLYVSITSAAHATYASVIAIGTGMRYAYKKSPTVTV